MRSGVVWCLVVWCGQLFDLFVIRLELESHVGRMYSARNMSIGAVDGGGGGGGVGVGGDARRLAGEHGQLRRLRCPACTFQNHPALRECELCQTKLIRTATQTTHQTSLVAPQTDKDTKTHTVYLHLLPSVIYIDDVVWCVDVFCD